MINKNNKIKLITLDMDGTLLNNAKEISPGNLKAIEACIAQGVHVVPATGRTVDGLPDSVRSIAGIRYAITVNGAMVEDLESKVVIDSRKMANELALDILDKVRHYHLIYDAYLGRRGVSEARFMDYLDDYNVDPGLQKLLKLTRDIVPDILDFVKTHGGPVDKINLIFAEPELRQRVRTILEARADIIVSSSMPNNLELNGLGATKGEALLRLASHLGIGQEETMACGDGDNDLSMIQIAGIGVAMENGDAQVKKLADYITVSNEKDGVARAIEAFVLNKI